MSDDYPQRIRPVNINTPENWHEIWKREGGGAHRRIDADRFANMAKYLNRDETILDVAGGLGEFLIFLRSAGFTNTLGHTDQADHAVDRARASGFESARASAYSQPFEARSWDVVTLGECIEHLEDPIAAVAEAARVARRAVIISTPYLTAFSDDEKHVWTWNLDSVFRLLAPHGRVRITMTTENKIIVAGAFRE